MNSLPPSQILPIGKLAACFNKTTSSYKFYWLLSILDQVENGAIDIPKRNLFAGMISHAWYTIHYYRLRFGTARTGKGYSDLLHESVLIIKEIEQLPITADRKEVLDCLINTSQKLTLKSLFHFDRYVPFKFLSPWFPGCSNDEIIFRSKSSESLTLYSFTNDSIKINDHWVNYLKTNVAFIRDFCYWHLALYLQNKNPNIPDIPNKLIKPAQRNNLSKQRHYWNQIFHDLGSIKCIYTHRDLKIDNYAVEHFIPHAFVSHDLLWNLIPSDADFNSVKGSKLPSLEKYFLPFFDLHRTTLDLMKDREPRNPLLDDYLLIFPDLETSISPESYYMQLQPLISIAANNGFEYMV